MHENRPMSGMVPKFAHTQPIYHGNDIIYIVVYYITDFLLDG